MIYDYNFMKNYIYKMHNENTEKSKTILQIRKMF